MLGTLRDDRRLLQMVLHGVLAVEGFAKQTESEQLPERERGPLLFLRFFSVGLLAVGQSSSPKDLRLRVGRPCSSVACLTCAWTLRFAQADAPLATTGFGDSAATHVVMSTVKPLPPSTDPRPEVDLSETHCRLLGLTSNPQLAEPLLAVQGFARNGVRISLLASWLWENIHQGSRAPRRIPASDPAGLSYLSTCLPYVWALLLEQPHPGVAPKETTDGPVRTSRFTGVWP